MKIKSDLVLFISFLILVISFLFFSIISHLKKGEERKEKSKIFRDSLFADLSLYGEIIEMNISKSGGRPTIVWCIKIMESSMDSFYVYNQELRTVFKIQKNLAVLVGLTKEQDKPRFIEININYPSMITIYNDDLEIILQDSMNSRFGIGFLLEQDMRICDHLIKD